MAGESMDLAALDEGQVEWLALRPALGREGSTLIMHCDSTLYLELGSSVEVVNQRVAVTLASDDPSAWAELEGRLWRRNELWDPGVARAVASAFGCERVVHGHTPIPVITQDDPAEVTEPLVYADGVCVNVDGGLYLGAPGFLFRLDSP